MKIFKRILGGFLVWQAMSLTLASMPAHEPFAERYVVAMGFVLGFFAIVAIIVLGIILISSED